MGEALLMNHGGMRFRELILDTQPIKQVYICGTNVNDYIDLTGAKILARIGTDLITLTEDDLSYSNAAVQAGSTAIIVSSTIGHTTKSVSIPITTITPDPILDNNSWDTISTVARWGKASEVWSVGDEKTVTINGSDVDFRIIGFDHDELRHDEEDSVYVRKNNGHAGITFQVVDPPGKAVMYSSGDSSLFSNNWHTSAMRTSTLVTYYEALPTALKNVIKTVTKRTIIGGYGSVNAETIDETPEQVFLISLPEITNEGGSYISSAEASASTQYEWYEENAPESLGDWIWTRSPHDPEQCSGGNHYIAVGGSNFNAGSAADQNYYYPAFCV